MLKPQLCWRLSDTVLGGELMHAIKNYSEIYYYGTVYTCGDGSHTNYKGSAIAFAPAADVTTESRHITQEQTEINRMQQYVL
jgi:hypothetical protein